jgi:basic amino acid/polyamine antiporter, APA family
MSISPSTTPAPGVERPGLLRTLGLFDLTAISLNTIIGSGIFLLPATVAATVGVWGPVSFLVSGVLSAIFAVAFAEAGSRFRETGGPYVYAREAFGDFVGFEVAWIFWLSRMAGVGASCNVFVAYLGHLFPGVADGGVRGAIITALIVAVAVPNYRGVRVGSFFTNMFTVAKVLPLLFLVAAGFWYVDWGRATTWPACSSADFMRSVLIVAFAYGGYELATVPAGEAKDPRRQLPRALFLAIGGAVVLYVLVQFVAQGLLPGLGSSPRPLADAASVIIGGGALLMTVGALVSTSGYVLGGSLVIPRLTFALAEHGQLPSVLARIHPRFRTPWVSILFHAVVTWLLAVGLSFFSLVMVNVLARLVVIGVTCAAVLRLRDRSDEPPAFRAPFGPLFPVAGILLVLYLLVFQTTASEVAYGAGALAAGSLVYVPLRWVMRGRVAGSRLPG